MSVVFSSLVLFTPLVLEMILKCMLHWMCGNTRRDKVRNEDIHIKISAASIEKKMRENRLR